MINLEPTKTLEDNNKTLEDKIIKTLEDKIIKTLEDNNKTIEDKLDNIDKNIKTLELKLEIMSKETKRMDSHVSFVENIYSSVQTPFHFIMNRVNNLIKIKQLNNK